MSLADGIVEWVELEWDGTSKSGSNVFKPDKSYSQWLDSYKLVESESGRCDTDKFNSKS